MSSRQTLRRTKSLRVDSAASAQDLREVYLAFQHAVLRIQGLEDNKSFAGMPCRVVAYFAAFSVLQTWHLQADCQTRKDMAQESHLSWLCQQ